MVQLKPSGTAIAQPKPKYGYLSEIDPEFGPLREETDKNFAALWSLPMDEFKVAWLNAPLVLPEDAPQPGKDYEVSDQQIPVRDGAKVGLRLYKPVKPVDNAVLVLKGHGGGKTRPVVPSNDRVLTMSTSKGWVVGSHEVEEVENRMLAAHAKVVVASVDYRMAPEYKFPYAINDCFDALKWVCFLPRQVHHRSQIDK
jgi:acetyl esterase/lipase